MERFGNGAALCIAAATAPICAPMMTEGDFQLGADLAGRRIVVAMSGGVDSSVVAALAARTGAETIGVTLQLYDHGEAVGRAGQLLRRAATSAMRARSRDRLGIAHYVFDHESSFRETVIDDFADEYLRRPHADPLRPLQHGAEVHRSVRARARSRRRLPRDRPLCPPRRRARRARSCTARPIRRATRAISCSRPRSDAARLSALSARRPAQAARCARSPPSWAWASRPSPTARTSASCPTAIMPALVKKLRPEADDRRRDRRSRRARARAASRA